MSDGSFPTPISKNDDANSNSNPIYVQSVGAVETITKVHNYATNILASNATANQNYTVVGTIFRLKRVIGSSTGQAKFEIQVGPIASLVTKAIILVAPNCRTNEVTFDPPIEVPVTGTGTVRVIHKNLQTGSNDTYATIIGEDVA